MPVLLLYPKDRYENDPNLAKPFFKGLAKLIFKIKIVPSL
jgi:hypothetical protein